MDAVFQDVDRDAGMDVNVRSIRAAVRCSPRRRGQLNSRITYKIKAAGNTVGMDDVVIEYKPSEFFLDRLSATSRPTAF